jgi:hypothetical protein
MELAKRTTAEVLKHHINVLGEEDVDENRIRIPAVVER